VSALTKIFVVLVVLLAIIQTAGMVVWINRSEQFQTSIKKLKDDVKAKEAEKASTAAQMAMVSGQKDQLQQIMQKQIDAGKQEIEALKGAMVSKDTQLAEVNSNLAQSSAAGKSASDALTVAQKTVDQQTGAINDLRKSELALQQRVAEQSFAINDWTNKYEVVNRQERDDREQITQLSGDNQKLKDTLHKAGVTEASARNLTGESLVRVEGVVRKAENIQGIPYATISVGAADQVTKGMQFKVIDPKSPNPFLGYLIVDRVEPNEAVGHLTGPRINLVHEGVEVHTQL
jgi:hypothetical protein